MRQIEKVFSWIGDLWKMTGIALLLLIVGHYFMDIVIYYKRQEIFEYYKTNVPAYNALPDAFWEEQSNGHQYHPEPYWHWKMNETEGQYINVNTDGIRRTEKLGGGDKKVFVFGGSTVWGFRVADWQTIPSYLQSQLGSEYDVYNFGQNGWVSAQEFHFLLHQLALGNIPDTVIFYDGANDSMMGTYLLTQPRYPNGKLIAGVMGNLDFFSELLSYSHYYYLYHYYLKNIFSDSDNYIGSKIDENAKQTIEVYEAHIKQVKAIAKEYGFKVFFFWQPNLFSLSKLMLPYETEIINKASKVQVQSQQQVYRLAKENFSGKQAENIYFLANLFDKVNEPVYFDQIHVGPNGNQIVANEIYERIKLKLSSSSVD
ncbi:MAG: hypothetical protein DRR16_03945 [Candidatus Parabeggiatoa sp. nov. 3]|nr:MAG: hypothetical protein DRR00_16575 [Gammaproteobacteria bacterium]RKZ59750.1 MAG: hypothetical protein DRQ99_23225 [Gammaproteobacteria bacterium]RKZ88864.1 MAG: hypothetical protein DRR16_03945 [Gammaproteobacteria bacterium]